MNKDLKTQRRIKRRVDTVNGVQVEYWEAQKRTVLLGFIPLWWVPITTSCGSPYVFNNPYAAKQFIGRQ